MSEKICPYPGLRPFTVEESYFFKGRDINIKQIVSKLETNKILILTGASGDGKSSLVYAGVIPTARAGFFKAKYNRWIFVDFRPERNPLQHLAKGLCAGLKIDYAFAEKELNYGFSSIIDLYKASPFFIDEENEEWRLLSAREQKKRKLEAANLFILADQFEEFFTNSENFNNGKTSASAYTTVNLLLETAKIALRENLPVYVICTLRSDFISQCIAFRGLPETIGFSQFFVPRLNRSELQQVIEEPALLSGGVVTKRLKEVLINELHDGFDQLPILQHTLKQIWEIAENGNEELDLIHLVKVGGLPSKYLAEKELDVFNTWQINISGIRKRFLEFPSSSNVLNAHANYLYETAFQYFSQTATWAEKNIDEEQTQHIIKVSFQCLTKIDQGRSVRNRATLKEIVNIINIPEIKTETVCGVINIFRLQGNTLLRPFITENDLSSAYLAYDTVLDITHEALIRNWQYLKKWNEEEYNNLNELNEFKVQLQRWLENNKSKYYLLPGGPLSHFEDWYNKCQPNSYWLVRYDDSSIWYEEKLKNAELIIEQITEYITSSRNFIESVEKATKRRRQILAFASLIVIIILLGFSYWALNEKANAQKQKQYAEQQTDSARYQQKLALEANQIAKKESLIAEENAQKALFAKRQSDSARNLAETLRTLAEEQTNLAKNESNKAIKEKRIADEQRKLAEEQRKQAEIQKLRAESASDSAKTLSYLAIAQSLSFKATQLTTDIQKNLLLSYLAYYYNKNYGGYSRDPAIYNALYSALTMAKLKFSFPLHAGTASSFYMNGSEILIHNKNGQIINYNRDGSKIIEQIDAFKSEIPVNYSIFIHPNLLIVSLENKQNELRNLEKRTSLKLDGHSDFIRTAAISNNNEYLLTGGRDKLLKIWRISNGMAENIQSFTFDSRITCASFSTDENTIYVGTQNGNLYKLNWKTQKQDIIESSISPVITMVLGASGKVAIAGFANGVVRIYDLNTLKKLKEITVSASSIKSISVNEATTLMAISTDDKILRVYDLYQIDKNPIVISNVNQRSLITQFSENLLFALTTDNQIWYLESQIETYSKQVYNLINRNFTSEEWNLYVGEKIPFINIK